MEGAVEVAVVGGGIAGSTIAYELARRGVRVTLFERDAIAGQASGRNMGLLLNQTEPGVVRIMRRSLVIYRELARGEVDFEMHEQPQLIIATDPQQLDSMHLRASELRAVGMQVSEIQNDEIRRHFQHLGPQLSGGYVVGDATVVAPAAATTAFVEAARGAGARVLTGTRVAQVKFASGRVAGLVSDGGLFPCDAVVLAAGPWLPELWRRAPVSIGRGWLLRTARLAFTLPWIVEDMSWPDQDQLGRAARAPSLAEVAAGHDRPVVQAFVIAQQPDGDALIGTSLSPSLRDPLEGSDMPARIAASAIAAAPGLATIPVTAAWSGLRPMTPDGMPLAGAVGPEGLWVHGGHGSIGMMTAPATAGWLADVITGAAADPELVGLDPGRFQR